MNFDMGAEKADEEDDIRVETVLVQTMLFLLRIFLTEEVSLVTSSYLK